MSNLTWTVEGNSDVLKLGKERLVELITQCEDYFYALILTDTYAINFKHWGKEVYSVTCKSIPVATIFHRQNHNIGCIQFVDTDVFQYTFHSQRGLTIYCKHQEYDAIVYKLNTIEEQEQLSIRIGNIMNSLSIERLLLLITLGKLLYTHVRRETGETLGKAFGTIISATVPHLS